MPKFAANLSWLYQELPFLDRFEGFEAELGVHDRFVALGIQTAFHVRHVLVREAAKDVEHRIHLANVPQELVAQSLAIQPVPRLRPG